MHALGSLLLRGERGEGMWGINSMANKPPASCRGLGLLMWTEIEACNLVVELDEMERTASADKLPGLTRRSMFTGEAAWLTAERLQGPKVLSRHRPRQQSWSHPGASFRLVMLLSFFDYFSLKTIRQKQNQWT